MFETTVTDQLEQPETIKSADALYELAEAQLAVIGGGAGIALCE
ncbi:MAG TPA: hypothetical protein VFE23_15180 [Usitatibacter sp.]|jgi:hypothetical protein|nr:hypothetical protein [Usitatibacter sp.]